MPGWDGSRRGRAEGGMAGSGDGSDGRQLQCSRHPRVRRAIRMYIVAIAWIYVVLLMSFTEASITAGAATFLFYGLAPLAILLYLMGTPQRRRNRRRREALERQEEIDRQAAIADPGDDPRR